jgi:hypothetical protein
VVEDNTGWLSYREDALEVSEETSPLLVGAAP